MTKTFFIVVPFSPAMVTSGGVAGGVANVFGKKKTEAESAEKKLGEFEEHRSQLEQRVGVVTQGLVRCGIRTVELGTEEIVELFYKIFNPGDTEKPIPLT